MPNGLIKTDKSQKYKKGQVDEEEEQKKLEDAS